MKILHSLVGMGGAALKACVSCLGKVTQIPHKGQCGIKKKKKKRNVFLHWLFCLEQFASDTLLLWFFFLLQGHAALMANLFSKYF